MCACQIKMEKRSEPSTVKLFQEVSDKYFKKSVFIQIHAKKERIK